MQVREDIIKQLGLKNPLQFRVPVFRSNLFYEVRMRDALPVSSPDSESDGSTFGDLLEFVREMLKIDVQANKAPPVFFQTAASLVSAKKVLYQLSLVHYYMYQ